MYLVMSNQTQDSDSGNIFSLCVIVWCGNSSSEQKKMLERTRTFMTFASENHPSTIFIICSKMSSAVQSYSAELVLLYCTNCIVIVHILWNYNLIWPSWWCIAFPLGLTPTLIQYSEFKLNIYQNIKQNFCCAGPLKRHRAKTLPKHDKAVDKYISNPTS